MVATKLSKQLYWILEEFWNKKSIGNFFLNPKNPKKFKFQR